MRMPFEEAHDGASADRARSSADARGSDLLSELLSPLRMRGESIAASSLEAGAVTRVAAGASSFHLVAEGRITLSLHATFHEATAGDLIMMPLGDAHTIAALDDTRLVSGTFRFDDRTQESIFRTLPPFIRIARDQGGNAAWLEPLVHFLLAEATAPGPGAAIMISRLIDVLVVRTLRSWAAALPEGANGWIGGLADPRIERALSAIHADPHRPWTLEQLAAAAAMSRSAFAARFLACTGEPPLRYLKNWRLHLARDLLRIEGARVNVVARTIGYDSDAAFSRAYKARFGVPPSGARQEA